MGKRSIFTAIAALALLMGAGTPAYADPGDNGKRPDSPPGLDKKANGGNAGGGNAGGGNAGGGGSTGGGNATTNAGASGNGGDASGDPNGANGTVKIHEWPDHKNGSDMANDPKVCQFEIHGFNFDGGQTGDWWVQEHKWGDGDASRAVISGDYAADGNGEWTEGPVTTLDEGHYKLFVAVTHTAGNSGNTVTTYKHKVFKVECEGVIEEEEEEEEEDEEEELENNESNGGVTGSDVSGGIVAGVQTPPTTTATGVAGQESAPSIAMLPSTSTPPDAPLALLGLLVSGAGAALLRTGRRR